MQTFSLLVQLYQHISQDCSLSLGGNRHPSKRDGVWVISPTQARMLEYRPQGQNPGSNGLSRGLLGQKNMARF